MSKRRPDNDLNHENWNDEEKPDEVGHFDMADEKEMKNRKIRVAKRRIVDHNNSSECDSSSTSAATAAAPSSAVFRGFSFLANKSNLNSAASSTTTKPLFSFGGAAQSQAVITKPLFSFTSTADSAASTTTNTNKANVAPQANEKTSSYCSKLKQLNAAVLSCIKGHVDKGQPCILTPIFKDYENYVRNLEDEENIESSTHDAKTTAAPSFSFSNVTSAATSSASNAFGSTTAIATSTVQSNTSSLFSFSKPPSVGFGSSAMGSTSSAAEQTSKSDGTSGEKEKKTNGTEENADDDEEPPKVEFVPVVESESIYSKRCKVFVKDDTDFKDRGTGTLYLKSVQGGKFQLIVRADTNLGNILLNILLSTAIPVKQMRNNIMLICIPTPDAGTKPKSILIRVKTEAEASELLEEITKHQN